VTEILKSWLNMGEQNPPLYFFRDHQKREIDLIIEKDGVLHPIEIKQTATPNPKDVKAFPVLDTIAGIRRGSGAVVCLSDKLLPLNDTDMIVPVWLL
jgi:predicted AAA+ superfamily ATPase